MSPARSTLPPRVQDKVAAEYADGHSIRTVAARLGVGARQVRTVLDARQIERRPAYQPGVTTGGGRRVDDEKLDAAVTMYRYGANLAVAARTYRLSDRTIRKALEQRGVPIRPGRSDGGRGRPRRTFTPEVAAQIVSDYQAGVPAITIAKQHQAAPKRVRALLVDNGVTIRRRGRPRKR